MEQIIIQHADGTTLPLFSKARVSAISKANQKLALLSDDSVSISVVSAEPLDLHIGDTALIFGKRYKINQLPQMTKNGERSYSYEIKMEGAQYDLLDVSYQLDEDCYGDTYYADLHGHLVMLIWNIRRIYGNTWQLGTYPSGNTEYKNINTQDKNCLQLTQELCTAYNVEFEIVCNDGTVNMLNFKSKVGSVIPITFKYGRGKGLYQLQRTTINNTSIVNRLYAYGSSENLGNGYNHTRLRLPGTTRLTSYIEDEDSIDNYGVKEGVRNYQDIKPQRIGEVTAVGSNRLSFTDSSMDFNLNNCLIPDTAAKIKFETGQLAGYEFELHSYDNNTHTFVINPFTDENGMVFPSEDTQAFQIGLHDKYSIFDITLPSSYIEAAEAKLLEKATEDLQGMSQPQVSYKLYITESYLIKLFSTETQQTIFNVGDYIKIEDTEVGVNKEVRIVQIERDCLKQHSYDITLSDTIQRSTTVRVINELENINEIIRINSLADPNKARANWKGSREVLNMVFDQEGDYFADKIKPLSIETKMLSVGAKSSQFCLVGTVIEANYNGDANTVKVTGGALQHYTISESGVRTWLLADTTIDDLSGSSAYYIYARCQRADNSNSGVVVFSTTQYATEQDPQYYYFLFGILNSTDSSNGTRSVYLTYGFTTINGRFIRTGRIESSGGGSCYFDLDNDEIGGVIKFKDSQGNYKNVSSLDTRAATLEQYVNGTLQTIIGNFTQQIDGKVETWYGTNDPSSAWTTSAEKAKHVGDLWYNTSSKESKRYSNSYVWTLIEDGDAIQALEDAARAQDTADGKRRVFTNTPYPPYDVGDLYTDGRDLYKCVVSKQTGNYSADDWEKATEYTSDENLNEFLESYDRTISDIYAQLDGVVETWFGEHTPTLSNAPASAWTTSSEREMHLGDIYYNNTDGKGYRFSKQNTSYLWIEIADTGITEALQKAQQAQDTADGKRRVFTNTPYPPYDVGDLWASGVFLKVCRTSRQSGIFSSSDWVNATEYTSDESLNDFIDGVFDTQIGEIINQLDGKIECWYSSSDPSDGWDYEEFVKHTGDQWYNTAEGRLYRLEYSRVAGFGWVEITNQDAIDAAVKAQQAQDTADGKRRVFTNTPYPPYDEGDLWTDGTNLYRCINGKETGIFDEDDWGLATNYTSDAQLFSFIRGIYATDKNAILQQIDGKIESWFQLTDPSSSWSTSEKAKHTGDFWYNTSTKELKTYVKQGNIYVWVKVEDQKAIDAYTAAANAQETADGKAQIFVTTPTPPYDIGDLWLTGGSTDGTLKRCITPKAAGGSYSVNDWVIAVYYDNTQTVIDGGIVTSGTVQLAGDDQSIKAGITGDGTDDTSVRIWAGVSRENRVTAPFRVLQDGSFYASKATIEGTVRANSGKIGGFDIKNGHIGKDTDESDIGGNGFSLYPDFLKFADNQTLIAIGTNVLPSYLGGMVALARFVNNANSPYMTNLGLMIDVTGGAWNIAVSAKGAILSNSYIQDYAFTKITPALNTISILGSATKPNIFKVVANFQI